VLKRNSEIAAIDTGGVSSRIMLMYSLNPHFGPEQQYVLYGHAAYMKYWAMVKDGAVNMNRLTVDLNNNSSPFNTYGFTLGLSRYMLERFSLYGYPESLGQNSEIAMHWLCIAHPYAYPKTIQNGSGARQALEYKIMGGSVEGILASG